MRVTNRLVIRAIARRASQEHANRTRLSPGSRGASSPASRVMATKLGVTSLDGRECAFDIGRGESQ
jgi:hypothetical protein